MCKHWQKTLLQQYTGYCKEIQYVTSIQAVVCFIVSNVVHNTAKEGDIFMFKNMLLPVLLHKMKAGYAGKKSKLNALEMEYLTCRYGKTRDEFKKDGS